MSKTKPTLEPSQPFGAGTAGRTPALSSYWPYALGALATVLILVGTFYLWQSARVTQPRGRHPARGESNQVSEVYCHQCGTRAHQNDRFCRVCGTKLRQEA